MSSSDGQSSGPSEQRPVRAFVAGLFHETNSFSPIPTNLDSCRFRFFRPAVPFELPPEGDPFGYRPFAKRCLDEGVEVHGSIFAVAQPSGPMTDAAYRELREEILRDLRRALPLDMVFLFMHGAQMTATCLDVEGELLGAVREIVGPTVPIAVELDLHANITPDMLRHADFVVGCLEYPHIDFGRRAEFIFDLLRQKATGRIRPVTVAWRIPVLGAYPTLDGPMQHFVQRARDHESRPGVLAVSMFHGFWLADSPWTAACLIVTTDGDEGLARSIGVELAEEFTRAALAVPAGLSIGEALEQALASEAAPVVIADRGDNPGGGAASDSTFMLQALLDRDVDRAVLGMIWDPMVVDFAFRAGEGACLPLRLGGKTGPMSGLALDVQAEVLRLRDDVRQAPFGEGPPVDAIGRSAALRIRGVIVIVNTERQQVFDPRVFTEHGIDLSEQRIVVVKSTAHFRRGFAAVAARIIDCDSPGALAMDLAQLPYRHLQRPVYPLDRDFRLEVTEVDYRRA